MDNIHTLFHHARGFGDAISGKAYVIFDKTSMSFGFQVKDGVNSYVSRQVKGNLGIAKGGAFLLILKNL